MPDEAPSEKRPYMGRITKPCENCGAPVSRKASHFKAHTFCSKKCYGASSYYATRLRVRNEKKYPDSRRREPCHHCGTIVDKPKSLAPGKRLFCNRGCQRAYALANPVRQVTSGGYIKIFVGPGYPGSVGNGHIYEHRKVMQDILGRPLVDDENVHHINGVRDDNRPENLELWSTSQPCGQRVEDKVRWAFEFLARYKDVTFIM